MAADAFRSTPGLILPEIDGRFYQIGIVTRDLEATMRSYAGLPGVGPWGRIDTDYLGRYRDWTGRIANRNAFARWNTLYLELVEPGIGESNAREWLENRGEGIFHLGFVTESMDRRPNSAPVCFESLDSRLADGGAAIVHLDTVDQLGYFVELAHRSIVDPLCTWIDNLEASKDL